MFWCNPCCYIMPGFFGFASSVFICTVSLLHFIIDISFLATSLYISCEPVDRHVVTFWWLRLSIYFSSLAFHFCLLQSLFCFCFLLSSPICFFIPWLLYASAFYYLYADYFLHVLSASYFPVLLSASAINLSLQLLKSAFFLISFPIYFFSCFFYSPIYSFVFSWFNSSYRCSYLFLPYDCLYFLGLQEASSLLWSRLVWLFLSRSQTTHWL